MARGLSNGLTGWSYDAVDIRFTSCCFGFLACLFVAAVPVSADTSYGGRGKYTKVIDAVRQSDGTYKTVGSWRLTSDIFDNPKFLNRATKVSKSSLGAMAKAGLKSFLGPVGLISTVFTASDWLFDEDGSVTGTAGSIYQPGEEGVNGYKFSRDDGQFMYAQTADQLCSDFATWANSADGASNGYDLDPYGNPDAIWVCQSVTSSRIEIGTSPWVRSPVEKTYVAATFDEPDTIVSDEQFADAIDQSPDNEKIVKGLAGAAAQGYVDPDTGSSDNPIAESWPELANTLASLEAWLESQEQAADLDSDGSVDQAEADAAPDPGLSEQPAESTFEIPTGCKLLPQVCEMWNWMQEPVPDPDEPTWNVEQFGPADLPEASNPLPSGGATCPSPQVVSAFGQDISISYQPFCDLALLIKPLLLAAASLFAILLLVKV